jgi:hypothetical protein
MRRVIAILVLAVISLTLPGCMTHIHKVGNGPQTGVEIQEKQWYALWGLIPISDVDTHEMADSATDYAIKTEFTPVDVIINIFTGIVTIYGRTVEVTK